MRGFYHPNTFSDLAHVRAALCTIEDGKIASVARAIGGHPHWLNEFRRDNRLGMSPRLMKKLVPQVMPGLQYGMVWDQDLKRDLEILRQALRRKKEEEGLSFKNIEQAS